MSESEETTEEQVEEEAVVEVKLVGGQCRFKPTKRHKPRRKGDVFEVPESILDQYGDILELYIGDGEEEG